MELFDQADNPPLNGTVILAQRLSARGTNGTVSWRLTGSFLCFAMTRAASPLSAAKNTSRVCAKSMILGLPEPQILYNSRCVNELIEVNIR